MTLTKADLTKAVQIRSPLSCTRASFLIDSPLEVIKRTFETGHDVKISRFGEFQLMDRKTSLKINLQAGNKPDHPIVLCADGTGERLPAVF